MRHLHPSPPPWPLRLAAFLASFSMASWVHLKTCLTQTFLGAAGPTKWTGGAGFVYLGIGFWGRGPGVEVPCPLPHTLSPNPLVSF